MNIKIKYSIKAIIFGVDESIIGKLNFGNSYTIERDSMANQNLWEDFDYTIFGLRRVYEVAKLNDKLEVALLSKNIELDYKNLTFKQGKGWFADDKEIRNIITDFENQEMNYVDEKMRLIRLYSENGFNIKELLIKSQVIREDNDEVILNYNSKIPFPDRIIGQIDKLGILDKIEEKNINDYIRNINLDFKNLNFPSKLLSSAAFLYDQSYTSPVVTLRFMVCVIGLESLLVDGNSELSYRLSRNCAMLLSSNSEEYSKLFSVMKKIYNKRSDYVHNGMVKDLEESDVIDARDILRKVIFKIIEKNISQKDLIKELDLKGYL